MDVSAWPSLREKFAAVFLTRSRGGWCALLEGTEVCCAPVLDMAEAPQHPHNLARATFVDVDGVTQPAPRAALEPHRARARHHAGAARGA